MDCAEATNIVRERKAAFHTVRDFWREGKLTAALEIVHNEAGDLDDLWPELRFSGLTKRYESKIEEEICLTKTSQMWPVKLSLDGQTLVFVDSKRTFKTVDLLSGTEKIFNMDNKLGVNPIEYGGLFQITESNDIYLKCIDPETAEIRIFYFGGDGLYSISSTSSVPYSFNLNEPQLASFGNARSLYFFGQGMTPGENFKFNSWLQSIDQIEILGGRKHALLYNYANRGLDCCDLESLRLDFHDAQAIDDFAVLRNSESKYLCLEDGRLSLMDVQGEAYSEDLQNYNEGSKTYFKCLAVEPDERFVVALEASGRGIAYDLKMRKVIKELDFSQIVGEEGSLQKVSLGANKEIILALSDGRIIVMGKKSKQ